MKKLFNHTKRPDRNWEEDVQDGYDWDEEEYTGEDDGEEYYADETDLPLFPGLLHRFIQAAAVTRFRAKGRIMKLINIYIISLQQAQTGFQVIPESCCCNRRCFSRNKYLLADTL